MAMPRLRRESISTAAYLALTDVVDSPVTVRVVFAGVIDLLLSPAPEAALQRA